MEARAIGTTPFRLGLLMTLVFATGCDSGARERVSPVGSCGVAGEVETTVFDGVSTYLDVPSTALSADPDLQSLEDELEWNLIDIVGMDFWSVTGSLRWTGELALDSATGLATGIHHGAEFDYELVTGDLAGLVFVPVDPVDTEGSFAATLHSQYWIGSSRQLTKYAFGFLYDYTGRSTDVTVDWRYVAATNELIFESMASMELSESSYQGWKANPVVSVCLGGVFVPPESP